MIKNEPEYANRQELPDVISVCRRCKRGILVYLQGRERHNYTRPLDDVYPWCYVCGNKQDDGIGYVRGIEVVPADTIEYHGSWQ